MIFATTQGRLLEWTIETQKKSPDARMDPSVMTIVTLGLVAHSGSRVDATIRKM
jgi:hypothetical protein